MHPRKADKPLVVAEEADTPTPSLSRKPLSKIEHCRAELANVYRCARAGRMDTGEASKFTYILYTLAKLIESDDLERRVAALERETNR